MPERYKTKHRIGENNLEAFGMDIHHPVFVISAFLILLFITATLIFPGEAKTSFDAIKASIIKNYDWLFIISANFFVIFCGGLIFHPFGKIRIGGKNARPDFSTPSWLSMLFAAGMGIGLMFWSVAEPVAYYTGWYGTPLNAAPHSNEGFELAMGATLYHWGLHPWSIYAVVGLSLAFFRFNKGLPLTIRSCFFPLLKEKSWKGYGDIIDIVAVLATIFGLATSLGFGAKQSAAGLNYLFGIDGGLSSQIIIIAVITLIATVSVIRGLDKGVKILSNINIIAALCLLISIFIFGPTFEIIRSWWVTLCSYLTNGFELSSWVSRKDKDFYHGWTIFYWAWWISWAPFVGLFIARISKGRSIREFLSAVVLIPTLATSLWLAAFGGSALSQIKSGSGPLVNGIDKFELSLFQMLEQLPATGFLSGLSILLVLCFFVTSSDSGSLVIDSITAGGKLDAPVPQRVFWAVMEGAIAVALLWGGGSDALGALQTAVISMGLPFCLILLIMCLSLIAGLKHERKFGD